MTGILGIGRARRVMCRNAGEGRKARGVAALALGASVLALSACEDGQLAFGGDGVTPGIPQTVQLVETDVEAPEIFQTTGSGLWDGRPSLGGVWVAHPDVAQPERVIIRNQENGNFVIGALFRRERDNPGPPLQVSSDAAEALGMLAGAPANLNVTALRREEAAQPVPTEATSAIDAETQSFEAAPEIASATLDAAPQDAAPIGAAPLGAEALATIAATPTPATAPDSARAVSDEPLLDPAALVAAAAAAMQNVPVTAAPAPAAATAAAPAPAAPAPAAPASSSAVDRPFIQLGIFSIEANAQSLAADMNAKGLTARVTEQQSQGRSFWRVLVGPAQSTAERASLLERVKAEGFNDAYFVRN